MLLTLPLPSSAFDNGPTWFDFNYTLQNTDARSLAMGGAAVATTDDASATLTNPAGLVRLTTAELRFDSTYLRRKEVHRPGASNLGTGDSIRLGLQSDETSQFNAGLMALAIPIPDREMAIALFYHKLLPYDRFITVTDPLSGGIVETHNVMFDLDEFGFSLAGSLFDDRLAIGLSASLVTLNMDIKALQDATPAPGSFNGAEFTTYGSQTEQEPIWRLGLLYRPDPKLAIALQHTIAPNPDYTMTTANSTATVNSAIPGGCSGDINNSVLPDGTPVGNWICKSSLPLPESTALGIAYSPNESWTFATEVTYIDYSRITKEFHSPYAYPGGDVIIIQKPDEFEAETGLELHFGLEFKTRIDRKPLTLRAGYFFDPAHDIRYRGKDATAKSIYPGGQDVHHFSTGFGLSLVDALHVDAAIDIADDQSHHGAISFAYRF
jgi:long-subunit fatty acid transport protein